VAVPDKQRAACRKGERPFMSEANTQAFNIKAYVNNLLNEKRELEAANSALEAEKTKLKQGILKSGDIAKTREGQNKELQSKVQMLQRQVDTLQQENARLSANANAVASAPAPAANYSSEIADTLLLAQRTAKQVLAEAEQRAAVLTQDTQRAVNNMVMSVSQIREIMRKVGNDMSLVEAHLDTIKVPQQQETVQF
jgi:hypothetical protein